MEQRPDSQLITPNKWSVAWMWGGRAKGDGTHSRCSEDHVGIRSREWLSTLSAVFWGWSWEKEQAKGLRQGFSWWQYCPFRCGISGMPSWKQHPFWEAEAVHSAGSGHPYKTSRTRTWSLHSQMLKAPRLLQGLLHSILSFHVCNKQPLWSSLSMSLWPGAACLLSCGSLFPTAVPANVEQSLLLL